MATPVGTYFPPPGTLTASGKAPTLCNIQMTTSGKSYICTFTLPANEHGIFEFVCTVVGHFPHMKGYLYVGAQPVPPSVIPSETNVVQLGIIAVAVILVGLAAFLVMMGMSEKAVPAPPKR